MRSKKLNKNSRIDPVLKKLFDYKLSKGDHAKAQIMDAFVKSIHHRGVEETNFATVASDLGVRRSHIAYHFKSKGALFDLSLAWIHTRIQDEIVRNLSTVEGTDRIFESYISSIVDCLTERPEDRSMFMLSVFYASYLDQYSNLYSNFKSGACERIKAMLTQILSENDASSIITHEVVEAIHSVIMGYLYGFFGTGAQEDSQELKKKIYRAVKSIYKNL